MSVWWEFLKARLDEAEQRMDNTRRLRHGADGPRCPRCDSIEVSHSSRDDFVTFKPCRHTMPNTEFWAAFSDISPDPFGRADVEAKRRIMARHKPGKPDEYGWAPNWCEGCGYEGEASAPRTEGIDDCPEIRDLASTWADHKDYPGRDVPA